MTSPPEWEQPAKARLCRVIMGCSLEEWEAAMGRLLTWGDLKEEAQHYAADPDDAWPER